MESRSHRLRWFRRRSPEHVMIDGDIDRARVAPGSGGGARRLELKMKLVRRPDIVIIEERHPVACCFRYPAIACGTLSKRHIVPHQAQPRIRHRSNHGGGAIGGSFVDDNHFQAHSTLLEHARQREPEQLAPVPRRNDDRNFGWVGRNRL